MRPLDHFDEPPYEPVVCSARLTDSHSGPVGPDGLCQSCHDDDVWNRTGGLVTLGFQSCDHCCAVSQLYQPFPWCRDCNESVCPACTHPGSEREHDGVTTVQCSQCAPCRRCDGEGTIEMGNGDTSQPYACPECGGREDAGYDSDYERAAARAVSNDFEDTDGKDWR